MTKSAPSNPIFRWHFGSNQPEDARTIRREVFGVEQGIPEHLDPDDDDKISWHLVVYDPTDQPLGTGRLTPKASSGVLSRIATVKSSRGKGLGKTIVKALETKAKELKLTSCYLRPHLHLEVFYTGLGYQRIDPSVINIEGLLLIEMEKPIK